MNYVINMHIYIVVFTLNSVMIASADAADAFRLYIEPNQTVLVKYVGDSVNLTCFLEHQNNLTSSKGKFVSTDFSDAVVHTLNWIIPNNGEDRVIIAEFKDRVTIHIEDLQETDYGNYTCLLLPEEASTISSKEAHIYLAVLPRGQISHCEDNSFFCEKSMCIPQRYLCDGHPDCPDGADESVENCGPNACLNKLQCDDGRCLSPQICCRESSKSPPNCTIHASIQCCRQLLHPALIDQDLFYMASRPDMKHVKEERNSGLYIGGIIAIIIAAIGLTMRAQTLYCRSTGNSLSTWYRNSPFNLFSSNPTDQYTLHSTDSLYARHLQPGEDFRNPPLSLLHCQENDIGNLVMISIPSNSDHHDFRPPPSYNQVVVGPPPPYSSQMDNFDTHSTSFAPNNNYFGTSLNSTPPYNDFQLRNVDTVEETEPQVCHDQNIPLYTAYSRSSQSSSVSIPINLPVTLSPDESSASANTQFPIYLNK